ncbi:MAG TPA: hypothetical protein VIL85_06125 [Thermomicrobiales bacterium]
MGPQEKRLLSELAVHLVRNCSRALQDLPPGTNLDLTDRRRWFVRAYHEWQLTPRVDLAGRSPYEVIAAERAAERATPIRQLAKPTIELYTDLPTFDQATPFATPKTDTPGDGPQAEEDTQRADHDLSRGFINHDGSGNWRRFADRLFGTWLDEKLDRL